MRGGGSAADSGAARAACRLRASPPGAARLLGAGRQVEREQQVLRRRQRGGEREAKGGRFPPRAWKPLWQVAKRSQSTLLPPKGGWKPRGHASHPAPLPACGSPPPPPAAASAAGWVATRCRRCAVRCGLRSAAASPSKCVSRLRAFLLLVAGFFFLLLNNCFAVLLFIFLLLRCCYFCYRCL